MKLSTQVIHIILEKKEMIAQSILNELSKIERAGNIILRWGLIKLEEMDVFLEVATIHGVHENCKNLVETNTTNPHCNGVHVALVVPTGVGASIGGFIGDAGPVARALETVADTVIVHPNVVNAADFYSGGSKCLYVDGLTLDLFFNGRVRLDTPRNNRIGLILDNFDSSTESLLLNVANGMRAVNGIDICSYVVCKEKVQVQISQSEFGHFLGEIVNADVLLDAAEILQKQRVNSIAVVTAIGGIKSEDLACHYMGLGPNPIGSTEALISRAITWKTGLPCAHAPAFIEGLGNSLKVVDPRAAAEVSSRSGLPCLFYGLKQSPKIVQNGGIGVCDLSTIIVPFECAGGPSTLLSQQFCIPLLAVKSNKCIVGARADLLNLPMLTVVENYAEAIAFVACQKAKVTWESINRPLRHIQKV